MAALNVPLTLNLFMNGLKTAHISCTVSNPSPDRPIDEASLASCREKVERICRAVSWDSQGAVDVHWIHANVEPQCSVRVALTPPRTRGDISINFAKRGEALKKDLMLWEGLWLQPIQKKFALACEKEGVACSFKVTCAAAQVLNNAYFLKAREFFPEKKPLLNQWLNSLKQIEGINAARQDIRDKVAGSRYEDHLDEEEVLYRVAMEKELLPPNFDMLNRILCEFDEVCGNLGDFTEEPNTSFLEELRRLAASFTGEQKVE